MIGAIFGKWKVLRRHSSDRNGTYWLCRCNCGNEAAVKQYNLLNKKSSECQACCRTTAAKTRTLAAIDSGINRIISRYRNKAIERGYAWELTRQFVAFLITQRCHYCGSLPSSVSKGPATCFTYNGLDRKNNKIGYTPENTVPCCGICNRWKSDIDVEQFVAHARRVARWARWAK